MNGFLLKKCTVLALILFPVFVFAQQSPISPTENPTPAELAAKYTSDHKYALVIGNGAYSGLTPLANPVNDAGDIAAVLEHLGFT